MFSHLPQIHQECRAPPHGTECPVPANAVFIAGERRTDARDRGAALVEAIGYPYGLVCGRRSVGDPVWEGDGCDGAGCGAQLREGKVSSALIGEAGGGCTKTQSEMPYTIRRVILFVVSPSRMLCGSVCI